MLIPLTLSKNPLPFSIPFGRGVSPPGSVWKWRLNLLSEAGGGSYPYSAPEGGNSLHLGGIYSGGWSLPLPLTGKSRIFHQAVKSCPRKKQECTFDKTRCCGGVLRSPTHRAKDARWMGHPKFHPLAGRQHRWGTQMKLRSSQLVHQKTRVSGLNKGSKPASATWR